MRTKIFATIAVMFMVLSASIVLVSFDDGMDVDGAAITDPNTGIKYWSQNDGTLSIQSIPKDIAVVDLTDLTIDGKKYIVTDVGFMGLSSPNLEKAILPDVKTIDMWGVDGCTSLTTMEVPNLESIDICAFEGCTALERIELPKVIEIGSDAFIGCTNLKEVIISDNLVSIGAAAFNGTSITKIDNLPQGYELKDNLLIEGTEVIGFIAGMDCIVPDGITHIDEYAFRDSKELVSIDTGNVNTIERRAFLGCAALTTVSMPNVLTTENGAFARCTALTTVSMPKIQEIGDSTFEYCKQLTDLELPDSLVTIGTCAFNNTGITDLSNLPKGYELKDNFMIQNGTTVIGFLGSPRSLISDSITEIASSAVSLCATLETVQLPNVHTINSMAFADCGMLKTVHIPNVVTVGSSAFYFCSSLESIDLQNVKEIPFGAFSNCSSLTYVNIPNARSIGSSAFGSCTALTSITMPKAQSIEMFAFQNCTELVSVSMPNVQIVEKYAFQNCTSLTNVVAPSEIILQLRADGMELSIVSSRGYTEVIMAAVILVSVIGMLALVMFRD